MPPQTSDRTPAPGTVEEITRIAIDRYRPVYSDAGSPTGSHRPPSPSHTGPRNTWSDDTSSHSWHHPATLRARLTVKQVCAECGPRFQCLDIYAVALAAVGVIWFRHSGRSASR